MMSYDDIVSVGAVCLNCRALQKFKAGLFQEARKHMVVPRLWGGTDTMYHRRINRVLQETRLRCDLPDVDALFLRRNYDYAGRVVRLAHSCPQSLLYKAITWRCKNWKRDHRQVFGNMGHDCRVSPCTWELQFDRFFQSLGKSWRECAADKKAWSEYRQSWICFTMGLSSQ